MSRRIACVATCNLNQWAMDFEANLTHIKASILEAKCRGASYRVGPELEITGYGCEDHFFELDTVSHSWEALADLLSSGVTEGILCDVGMPVMHRGVLYNCRVFLLGRRLLLIRPKMHLANDGNYRETRYFAAWKHRGVVEDMMLPPVMASAVAPCDNGKPQLTVPFGDGVLQCLDTTLAAETCEELFTPQAPHIALALAGVEIISNGSGSHHQLRKLNTRLDLIKGATAKAGGVYLYANQRGCDGGRLYYDGCASVAVNGEFVAQGAQFGLEDVEVVMACVDLDEVVSFRGSVASLREQASSMVPPHWIQVDFRLCKPQSCYGASACIAAPCPEAVGLADGESDQGSSSLSPSLALIPRIPLPEEEIAYGPACWLWDYLRRSGGAGYLLPLSGGADSASTAAIVGAMCQMVQAAVRQGDQQVIQDARRVGQYGPEEALAPTSQEFASRVFVTVYMGTVNSSKETRDRAAQLAKEVGSYHINFGIDSVVEALVTLFATIMGKRPAFRVHGGSNAENLALQNIQARLRMVIAFLLAQLVPWVRDRKGFLLVLGSANVDESLRGYLTKYDNSAADVNPIGGISKQDLRRFLHWGSSALGYPSLHSVVEAVPTAELEPLTKSGVAQTDEADMGMTYEELSLFGRLRKVARAGPASAYLKALDMWRGRYSPESIAAKVKHFFMYYAINRHKSTVLTPAYHAESYSPDDNRFDHRQFLYNVRWPWQFKKMDELVARS